MKVNAMMNEARGWRWAAVSAVLWTLAAGCSTSEPQTEPDGRVGDMGDPNNAQDSPDDAADPSDDGGPNTDSQDAPDNPDEPGVRADVTQVSVSGSDGAYTFSVTLRSDDTGCPQFADWWEVLDEEGNLLYRRVLLHSHVDEQPFTRSGGPVNIDANTTVIVRAHMNTTGYAPQAQLMRGTPTTDFQPFQPPQNFAANAETLPPLPTNCAF